MADSRLDMPVGVVNTVKLAGLAAILFLLFGCSSALSPVFQEVEGVTNVRLFMDDDSALRLIESVGHKEETHCLYLEDGILHDAFINVRGDVALAWDKKSFAIAVERPDGIREYAFDASYVDPSFVRNNVALHAYREIGLPAPATEPVALFLNDRYLGFYTRVDIYQEDTLREFYGTQEIQLYKCAFRNPGQDLPIQDISEKKIPRDDDFTALAVLFTQVLSLSDSDWDVWSADHFDIGQTARYLAVHNFLGVADTISKNFYVGLHDGRYFLLPWDNENSFNSYYPVAGNSNLAARLLAPGTVIRAEYDRIMDEYFYDDDRLVNAMIDRVNDLYDTIAPAVFSDPNRPATYEKFLSERQYLLDYLVSRADTIR